MHGRVQGVGFRWSAVEAGRRFGVTGWVRNLPTGEVEATVEGDEVAVEQMLDWLRRGPPLARVSGVTVTDEPYAGHFTDFRLAR